MRPFEDKEEVDKIKKERDDLFNALANHKMSDSEKRFVLKKIQDITEKLLEKARYKKDVK